jgi:chromosomal replication initiator protein
LARENSGESLTKIAATFGGRNHTTALNACRKVEKKLAEDKELEHDVKKLRGSLFRTRSEAGDDDS